VLITEGDLGIRGVTFVIGNGLGVVGSQLLVVLVLMAVDRTEAELGVNFESGCGPEGISGHFDSSVGLSLGLKLG
jgi:hypothetical protein